MRRFALLPFLLALAFPSFAATLTGRAAPAFSVPRLGGGVIELSQLRGKLVYLDFWASWCGPCRKSFPWMQEMQARYGAQGLQVVTINLDQDAADRDRFMKKVGFVPSFGVGLDPPGKVAEEYQVKGMPSSYLIDAKGITLLEHAGFREDGAVTMESAIKSALGVK